MMRGSHAIISLRKTSQANCYGSTARPLRQKKVKKKKTRVGICRDYLDNMYSPPSYPPYAELHCCSSFSFLKGASLPEELIEHAAALGYTALAITDECSMAGVVRAHSEARKA